MTLLPHQPLELAGFRAEEGDPARLFRECALAVGDLLAVEFELTAYWLDDAPVCTLVALYLQTSTAVQLAVTDRALTVTEASTSAQFARWVAQGRCAIVEVGAALPLAPVHISKPWGQEIWFSGIERRGVSAVRSSTGTTPIPWLQAAMPDSALGGRGDLVLLKILDPVPESVKGDLYFELHQQKREVYVVTHIDPQAWPDGVGYIRYGFSPDRIAAAGSEEAFKREYLAAVRAYERTRRELDAQTPAATSNTPSHDKLLERERRQRAAMDSYCDLKPLRVGDVVQVPLRLPHSLQHGVRTIEFQTPVYERMILSFAQQVLTQTHWDTEEAIATMVLRPPPEAAAPLLMDEPGVRVEQIVDFADFSVLRLSLKAGATTSLPVPGALRVGMVVTGRVLLNHLDLGPEEAALLPKGWSENIVVSAPCEAAVFLLAIPVH